MMDGQTPEGRKAQAEARKARREGGGYRPRQNGQSNAPKPKMASTSGFDDDYQF